MYRRPRCRCLLLWLRSSLVASPRPMLSFLRRHLAHKLFAQVRTLKWTCCSCLPQVADIHAPRSVLCAFRCCVGHSRNWDRKVTKRCHRCLNVLFEYLVKLAYLLCSAWPRLDGGGGQLCARIFADASGSHKVNFFFFFNFFFSWKIKKEARK